MTLFLVAVMLVSLACAMDHAGSMAMQSYRNHSELACFIVHFLIAVCSALFLIEGL